jgi:membrane-associated protease RseP (regulator of RpoE activity)
LNPVANEENLGNEKEPGRVEFNFPMLTVRTKMFNGVFERLGSFRASRLFSRLAVVIVPVVAAIGLYLLINSLLSILWTPAVREISRELGPSAYLMLPGINPTLPLVYGWIAIICAVTIHEGAHGIVARNLGFNVKSSGLLFFLFIPIGAFVDVDEKQIAKAKPKPALKVMAAGVGGNILVAVVCLLGVIIIINGLTPVVDGVYVSNVIAGGPADKAGLLAGDVFISIDNVNISRYSDLKTLFADKQPGDMLSLTMARGEKWADRFTANVTLADSEGRAIIGVNLGDLTTNERLQMYKTVTPSTLTLFLVPPALAPGLVPFSDSLSPFYTHPLGPQWVVFANVLFWLWFVNVNVAVFNALPIYPLDGGRMFKIALQKMLGTRASEKTIYKITVAVTATLVLILLIIIVVPFIW